MTVFPLQSHVCSPCCTQLAKQPECSKHPRPETTNGPSKKKTIQARLRQITQAATTVNPPGPGLASHQPPANPDSPNLAIHLPSIHPSIHPGDCPLVSCCPTWTVAAKTSAFSLLLPKVPPLTLRHDFSISVAKEPLFLVSLSTGRTGNRQNLFIPHSRNSLASAAPRNTTGPLLSPCYTGLGPTYEHLVKLWLPRLFVALSTCSPPTLRFCTDVQRLSLLRHFNPP